MPEIISSDDNEVTYRKRSVRSVRFFVTTMAVDAMTEAADADLLDDRETMGLVIGKVYKDEEGEYAIAERTVTSKLNADAVSVRFDQDSMEELIDAVDEMKPGERIVAWYHSHLGYGCFMSETDVNTQHSIFGNGIGFAIVVDPVLGEFAVFDNSEMPQKIQAIMME